MDTLIVLAAGRGVRLGSSENKVYEHAGGRPLLWYPLEAAANFVDPVRVVIVIRPEDRNAAEDIISGFGNLDARLVAGGPTRHESEKAGLDAVDDLVGADDLIGIHDGARPFLTVDLWESCWRAADVTGGAVPLLSAETIYHLDEQGLQRLDAAAHKAQTPQVFRAAGLITAFRISPVSGTDTAETVMRHGKLEIAAVPGDRRNIKVTFPADLERVRELARSWRAGRWLTTG